MQLKLDKQGIRRAEKLAAARNVTLEQLLQDLIVRLGTPADPLLGLFRDEPDLLDRIVEQAMTDRETRPLRLPRE